jgi:hypothetical protein
MIKPSVDAVAAVIQSAFDAVPFSIQVILKMITSPVEAILDSIALSIQMSRQLGLACRPCLFRPRIQSIVDSIAPGI